MKTLPHGWCWTTADQLAAHSPNALTIGPFGSNLKVADYTNSGVPLVFVRDIRRNEFGGPGTKFVTEEKARMLAGHSVHPGDLLVTKMGDPPGDTAVYPINRPAGIITADCIKLTANHRLTSSQFLSFALRAPYVKNSLLEQTKGVAQQKLSLERFRQVPLPLPPLNEQSRILSKLESLLARSRRAKEALNAVPALLERFRQSVLASAFRGDLTADWRAQHPDVEPASQLLERIRAERRRRWEEAELEKIRAKGKTPKNEAWKIAYEEPVSPNPSQLPELPNNWCWASLGELTEFVTSGSRGWADFYSDTGPTFLRVGNLDRHTIDLDLRELSHVVPPEGAEGTRTKAAYGDILISITADVGMVGVVPEGLGDAYVNQHIALCRPLPMINVRALAYALTDPKGLQKIVREIQYGATKASLSLIQVRNLPVPLPPLAEQAALASRLDSALAVVKRVEQQITELSARQQALDEAVLAKAFRGELVPQDPNDEPASVLLERLRAEREASDGSTPKRSRGRRPAA